MLKYKFGFVVSASTSHSSVVNLNDVGMWTICFSPFGMLSDDEQGFKPPHLDASINLRTVIPIGFATAGDILLSNLSFMVSTVAFYTIVKSGSLMW